MCLESTRDKRMMTVMHKDTHKGNRIDWIIIMPLMDTFHRINNKCEKLPAS